MRLVYTTAKQGPPGPPPRPGLEWREETHRWVRPEDAEAEGSAVSEPTQPRAGWQLDPESLSLEEASQSLNMDPEKLRDLLTSAYATTLPGYTTRIAMLSSASSLRPDLKVRAMVYDDQGNGVAVLRRRFIRMGDELVADHEHFNVQPRHQGEGLAVDILEQTEDAYVRHGVQRISLYANEDVGGYAWARQGYDFADDGARAEVDAQVQWAFSEAAEEEGLTPGELEDLREEYHSLQHAWEVAAWNPLNAEPGEHLGKRLLLGSGWNARKVLDPSDLGYQVGRLYRKARRAHLQEGG